MSEPFYYYVRPDALKTREQILKLDDLEEWVQVIVIGKEEDCYDDAAQF